MVDKGDGSWRIGSSEKYNVFALKGSDPHFHYTQDRETGFIHGTFDNGEDGKTHFGVDPRNVVGAPFSSPERFSETKLFFEQLNREAAESKKRDTLQNLHHTMTSPFSSVKEYAAAKLALSSYGGEFNYNTIDYDHIARLMKAAHEPVVNAPMRTMPNMVLDGDPGNVPIAKSLSELSMEGCYNLPGIAGMAMRGRW